MKYEEVKELLSKGFTADEIRKFMSDETDGKPDSNEGGKDQENPNKELEVPKDSLNKGDDVMEILDKLTETVTQLGANVKAIQDFNLKKTSTEDLGVNTIDKCMEDFIKEL